MELVEGLIYCFFIHVQEVVNNNELVKSPDKSGLREGKRCYPSRRWSLIRGSSGKLHCLSYVCSSCQGLYLQCLFVSGFLSLFIFFLLLVSLVPDTDHDQTK